MNRGRQQTTPARALLALSSLALISLVALAGCKKDKESLIVVNVTLDSAALTAQGTGARRS